MKIWKFHLNVDSSFLIKFNRHKSAICQQKFEYFLKKISGFRGKIFCLNWGKPNFRFAR